MGCRWLNQSVLSYGLFGLLALCHLSAPLGAQQRCSGNLPTIGVLPLSDLGTSPYLPGIVGGLYPGGTSVRPLAHLNAGSTIANNEVVPRDGGGTIDLVAGRIGLVSIGMSNTTQEFAQGPETFKPRMEADPTLSPFVTIIDGAQGGQAAANWVHSDTPWNVLSDRVSDAGLTPQQVQVAWVKTAKRLPGNLGGFPSHAEILRDDIKAIVTRLRTEYPNLRLAFLSSRTRAYTDDPTDLNPEPFAFESGYSVRWAIEEQINGAPGLNSSTEVPWIGWGPYIWVDGTVPRSDGLTWLTTDVTGDCTHPSTSGRIKVSDQLVAFFKSDSLTVPWFLRPATPGEEPTASVTPTTPTGPAPLTVNFVVNASSPVGASITDFAWHFDDGTTSIAQNPTKTFPSPGSYTVQLTVSAADGNATTQSIPVVVTGPVAAPTIVAPGSPLEGLTLNDFAVSTFVATGTAPISWAVTGGTIPQGLVLSPGGALTGTPATGGAFSFTVTATNSIGSDSVTITGEIDDPSLTPTVDAEADAYVRDGNFSGTNFGLVDSVAVRGSPTVGQNVQSFLRFALPMDVTSVQTATLNVRFSQSIGGAGDVTAYFVADDNWNETGVTWDNRPALTTQLGTVFVVNLGETYSWDVTGQVNSTLDGDGVLTLALVDDTLAGPIMFFESREGSLAPFLELTLGDVEFIRGDTNGDGLVDLSDAVGALSSLFTPAFDPCVDALDVNDDGMVDISDPVSLLGFLFSTDAAPPAPHPGCGLDATVDALSCAPFGVCAP